MESQMTLSEYMTPLLERASTLHAEVKLHSASDDTEGVDSTTQAFGETLNSIQEVVNAHIVALLDELSDGWPYVVSNLFGLAYGPPDKDGMHLLALNFAGIVHNTTCKPTTQYHAMYFCQAFAEGLNAHFKREKVPVYVFVGIDDTITEDD